MSQGSPRKKSPFVEKKFLANDIESGKRIASNTGNSSFGKNGEEHSSGVEDRADTNGHARGSNTLHGRRYFIIKSLNHQNIELSIEKGIWATQVMNEPILDAAFHSSDEVILIFSVNMSGFFQGYARMTAGVGWRRDNVWGQGSGRNNPWGKSFKVKWLRLSELPFENTLHLKNPLNDYKPVKISRDCQELTEETGQALCQLLDEYETNESANVLKSFEIPSKRRCVKPGVDVRGGEYNMPPLDVPWMKQSRSGWNFSNSQTDHTKSPRLDSWAISAELDPLCNLSEDEFLKMSYEEYLEAYYRFSKHLQRTALGKTKSDLSTSRTCGDDIRSRPERSGSHKRHHVSSYK